MTMRYEVSTVASQLQHSTVLKQVQAYKVPGLMQRWCMIKHNKVVPIQSIQMLEDYLRWLTEHKQGARRLESWTRARPHIETVARLHGYVQPSRTSALRHILTFAALSHFCKHCARLLRCETLHFCSSIWRAQGGSIAPKLTCLELTLH